jgi:hypothetical protein
MPVLKSVARPEGLATRRTWTTAAPERNESPARSRHAPAAVHSAGIIDDGKRSGFRITWIGWSTRRAASRQEPVAQVRGREHHAFSAPAPPRHLVVAFDLGDKRLGLRNGLRKIEEVDPVMECWSIVSRAADHRAIDVLARSARSSSDRREVFQARRYRPIVCPRAHRGPAR